MSKRFFSLINVLVIVALIFSGTGSTLAQSGSTLPARQPDDAAGIFRAMVSYPNSTSRARLEIGRAHV